MKSSWSKPAQSAIIPFRCVGHTVTPPGADNIAPLIKETSMPSSTLDQCADPTKELSLNIPCRLAERVEAYSKETGTDIENVVIEALDMFLRERKSR